MEINDISKQLPNMGSNGVRKLSEIVYAVVHHDAVEAKTGYDPLARYRTEARYHIGKGWKRLSYHFKIDSKGNVYQCSPLEEIAYHAGNWAYNRNSIGICLDGDFTKQSLPKEQEGALLALLEHLCFHRPDVPKLVKATLRTHKEVRLLPTACPGEPVVAAVKAYRGS